MTSVLLKPKIKINGKRYSILNSIAEGAVGFVYRVKSVNLADFNHHYALKKMICQEKGAVEVARIEINLMRKITHPNVISLVDSEMTEPRMGYVEVHMLLPLFATSLQGFIDDADARTGGYPLCAFSDGRALLSVLRNVADGLECIHSAGFRHADLKPGNVLLQFQDPLKGVITDLGSVCPLVQHCTCRQQALCIQEAAAVVTTASYRSPELFQTPSECTIDGKADVWGFGCLMYTTCFSRSPFEPPGTRGFCALAVLSGTFHFPAHHPWPAEYLEIISLCLAVEVSARLSVADLQQRLQQLPVVDLSRQKKCAIVDSWSAGTSMTREFSEGALPTLPPPLAVSSNKVAQRKNVTPAPPDESLFADFANFDEAFSAATTSSSIPPAMTTSDNDGFGTFQQADDDEFGEFVS